MRWNISNIKSLTIVGLIIYIILLQECRKGSFNTTQVISDTSHTTIIDTIPFNDTVFHRISIKIPEKITSYDTVEVQKIVEIVRDSSDTSIYTYLQTIEDSLIEGTLETKVKGKLLSNDLNYKAKFPQYIHRIDTVKISTTIEKVRLKVYVGAELGGSIGQFNISPMVIVSSGKGFNYNYRYGVIDKTHNIGVTRLLRFKKQSIINGHTKGLKW